MVVLKLGILLFVIAMGAFWVRPENWTPFAPNGWAGISAGAALIFFAYIGFDAVSTAAEEAKNPQKDMPRAMIASLLVTSLIYIVVTLVLTGLVPWDQHGTADPLASAFGNRGYHWAAGIISFGAVVSMASVLLVFQLGQPRIFFSMARDGLLPQWAAKLHPRYRTPHVTTILTGAFVAFFAAFANINEVIELTNIGTLFAFVLVAAGVMALRLREPERHRPFRTPAIWFVAPAAIVSCGYLMLQLPRVTWERFILWLAVGLVLYFVYGYRHSRLRTVK
jgi:APA family basic amino acid/polyamine antiporter